MISKDGIVYVNFGDYLHAIDQDGSTMWSIEISYYISSQEIGIKNWVIRKIWSIVILKPGKCIKP